jgi:beta-xylosidase
MLTNHIVVIMLLAAMVSVVTCSEVIISNVVPRRDTAGNIIDAHDGSIFLYDGLYYYYGPSYGLCQEPSGPSGCTAWHPGGCGFQLNHNVSLYTSTDLSTWTFRGYVFQMSSLKNQGIMFCPRILPNPKTKKWVMWFNFLPAAGTGVSQSLYAVAISDTPQGPFQLVTDNVTTLAWENTGDLNLFQDNNGDAYIIYTAHIDGSIYNPSHLMSVEKLSEDYLSSLGKEYNSGFFGQTFVEAPAMFKRNGMYYAVFGQCCCYCAEGSGVTIYTSASSLGPFKTMNYLGNEGHAQQFNVLQFNTTGNQGYGYLWQGNRWQSSPDGAKGHDFQYWSPMSFDQDGNVNYMNYTANFTIDVISDIH